MRSKASPIGLLTLVVALFVLAFGVAAARADTGNIIEPQNEPHSAADGWQAANCTTETPKCSPSEPNLFSPAAGHPQFGFTQYTIQHEPFTPLPSPPFPAGSVTAPIKEPTVDRTIKTLRVDIPAGTTVNPQATEKCSLAEFENMIGEFHVPLCKEATIVGREEATVVTNVEGFESLPKGFVIPANEPQKTKVPLYNLEPNNGEPALYGFVIGAKEVVFLNTEVAWQNDFHESFTIHLPPEAPPVSVLISRLVSFGRAGDGTYITNPTTCFDPKEPQFKTTDSTFFRAESYGEPNPSFPNGSTPFEAPLEKQHTGCAEVPFEPALDVAPGTDKVDSPAAATVTTTLPFKPDENGLEQSHVRDAEVRLPEGMALNPSAANGLQACTAAQFGKGTRNPIACPAGSQIGTAAIETHVLPAGSLAGNVYLAQQHGFNPESGEMFRIFIDAKSDKYGVDVRLIGNVKANANTGQLTTTVNETPQAPFESVKLHFDEAKGVLTSPPTCGPNETNSRFEPWSTPASTKQPSSKFALAKAPDGGNCPKTLGERPFSPTYKAGPNKTKAGAFSPFQLHVTRPAGAQEIRRIEATLPPGMVAKLKGTEYCPEASISAARSSSGANQIAHPSCPSNSQIGTVDVGVGSGTPFHTPGKAYLAGPYKGAPISAVFVVPAVAGPFDLGTDVVRTALNIDPETAEVHAVSDPIPYVFGGVKLDIRSIDVSVNRKSFTLNPTTCREPFAVSSSIFGGGANPASEAAWVSSAQSTPFQATECSKLQFKPKFYARILGGKNQTKRTKNPKFRATLEAQNGNANLRRAAFILPRATILDQSHIKTVCTRVQLAANECPKNSIYGHAKATSPLLADPVKGPVYMVSSNHTLPDLLADLHGQVPIRLRGVISSEHGRLKTVFNNTPDVAVSKFILTMKGGNKGLLVNSRDLCQGQTNGFLNLKAQNSRQLKRNNLRLNIPACGGGKKH